jgi:hypothetical protein
VEKFSSYHLSLILAAVVIASLLNLTRLVSTTAKPLTATTPATSPIEEKEKITTSLPALPAPPASLIEKEESVIPEKPLFQYIEVVDSCGPTFEDGCLHARSGPGENYSIVGQLRKGMTLRVAEVVQGEDDRQWYKIQFDKNILYPKRISGNWYVAADFVLLFFDDGELQLEKGVEIASSTKIIIVDRTKQTLTAYEGEEIFMQESVSTGLRSTPTPRGTFNIYKKTPSRYMQGPLPGVSDQYYDLPGVPWVMYFTSEGGAIHGTYWHDKFGQRWSHGCVNLSYENAQKLYQWADLNTKVVVQN